ncbi:hypothetical protein CLROS_027030 [Clostridium felsineum]|uniref:Uncharacterized protein n=3 Tax=Clostridium felsineum TaxID=36839 RepID=A0A1S8M966_9CLOT|nr:hypothetical protein CLAUR_045150 [Clostridium felsineum]URZ07365.1 hypothetical protein CLROS_027030 [Clostridium felsineum]URZ12396.1 hypothetical protein CROST_031180 [Clostridium felsineum]URZ17056.1 hypothetical protein CLFE_031080 [Clostridium felsineum DSM 794]
MVCPYIEKMRNERAQYNEVLLVPNRLNVLKVGQKGWIILESNTASTGYSWRLIPNNKGIYTVDRHFYLPPAPLIPGTPGRDIWVIKAVKMGRDTIVLNYGRGNQVAATARYAIEVR